MNVRYGRVLKRCPAPTSTCGGQRKPEGSHIAEPPPMPRPSDEALGATQKPQRRSGNPFRAVETCQCIRFLSCAPLRTRLCKDWRLCSRRAIRRSCRWRGGSQKGHARWPNAIFAIFIHPRHKMSSCRTITVRAFLRSVRNTTPSFQNLTHLRSTRCLADGKKPRRNIFLMAAYSTRYTLNNLD
jgi:hypothetical protein